jgi:hypothetical protein
MKNLVVAVIYGACVIALTIVPATAAPSTAHAAKKCKKSHKSAVVAKKKCKPKPAPTAPPTTTSQPPATSVSPGPTGPTGPLDGDGDGVPDSSDNCASVSNHDQADADVDGKGDACDACPATANPGANGCPTTIYAINDGSTPAGSYVRVTNAMVSAVASGGGVAWVQIKNGDPGYTDVNNSGLRVIFFGVTPQPALNVGDRITIDGTATDQNGPVLDAAAVTPISTGGSPDVTAETAADFATKPPGLNGVLISVASLTIDSYIAGPPPTNVGGWNVSSGAITGIDVTTGVTQSLPNCALSTTFTSITGLADTRGIATHAVLGPRGNDDLAGASPTCS